MHALQPNEHTLDDLVRETGYSKRQIRFYITRKLIPGAGESRGPNAVYGEETLRRLQLIKVLRDMRIEPTGRQMTLDEIGHAMDTLSADGIEALLGGRAELAILDSDAGAAPPMGSAEPMGSVDSLAGIIPDPVAGIREFNELPAMKQADFVDARAERDQHFLMNRTDTLEGGDSVHGIHNPMRDLLGRLQALLAGTDPDTRSTGQAGVSEQWLRVATPEVEIHVRQPDDRRAQLRLARMARELAGLLETEE